MLYINNYCEKEETACCLIGFFFKVTFLNFHQNKNTMLTVNRIKFFFFFGGGGGEGCILAKEMLTKSL